MNEVISKDDFITHLLGSLFKAMAPDVVLTLVTCLTPLQTAPVMQDIRLVSGTFQKNTHRPSIHHIYQILSL